MGGTIKQNRAINWGHLESCHFPFCARLFASIQKYIAQGVIRCQCCVIPIEDAEVLCTGVSVSIHTGMHNTGIVYRKAYSAEDFSLYLDKMVEGVRYSRCAFLGILKLL